MMTNMTRLVSLSIVTLLIVILGVMFFHVIAPFLLPLFLAGVFAMLAQSLQQFFEKKTEGRTNLAAALTTGSVILGTSVPVVLVVLMATFQAVFILGNLLGDNNLASLSESIRTHFDIDRVTQFLLPYVPGDISEVDLKTKLIGLREELQGNLRSGLQLLVNNTIGMANRAVGLMGSLAALAVSGMMFVIALYYFLADGPALLATSERLIPLSVDYQRELRSRFNRVVRAVVLATFLAALGQGLATAFMLSCYYGFRHFMILFLVATFASMVPLFGTWLVWGPCAIWLMLQGVWLPAILFLVFGIAVIGTMDNLIRTYVLQSDAQLHPLLAFVSVLGGVQAMGLWGVFIAPIVAAFLHALIVIFNTEISEMSKERPKESSPPKEPIKQPETPTQPTEEQPEQDEPPTSSQASGRRQPPGASET